MSHGPARGHSPGRLRLLVAAGAILAVAIVVAAGLLVFAPEEEPSARPSAETTDPVASFPASSPQVVGLPLEEALDRLERESWQAGAIAWVPSETPEETVVDQLAAGPGAQTLDLVISDGGPVRDLAALPAPAQHLLRGTDGGGDPAVVRVLETEHGEAFKTDALLVGPCAAVEEAYRVSLDARYDTECY